MLQITQSGRVNEKSVPRAEHEDGRVTAKPRFWNMSRILVYNRILYMYVCSAASVWARLNQGFGPVVYTRVPRCTNVSGFKNTSNQNFYSDGGADPNPKWKERKLIVGIQKKKELCSLKMIFSQSKQCWVTKQLFRWVYNLSFVKMFTCFTEESYVLPSLLTYQLTPHGSLSISRQGRGG